MQTDVRLHLYKFDQLNQNGNYEIFNMGMSDEEVGMLWKAMQYCPQRYRYILEDARSFPNVSLKNLQDAVSFFDDLNSDLREGSPFLDSFFAFFENQPADVQASVQASVLSGKDEELSRVFELWMKNGWEGKPLWADMAARIKEEVRFVLRIIRARE